MNEDQSKIIERIEKLLRLHEDASATEGESQAAFAAAAKLMTKYGIQRTMLRTEMADAKEAIEYHSENVTRVLTSVHEAVRSIMLRTFNVELIPNRRELNATTFYYYWYVGTREDVAFAVYAFEFLCDEIQRLYDSWTRNNNIRPTQNRLKSYAYAAARGFAGAWMAARDAEIKAAAEAGQAYALVLADDKALVRRKLDQLVAQGTISYRRRRMGSIDADASSAGYRHGSNISLRNPIEG